LIDTPAPSYMRSLLRNSIEHKKLLVSRMRWFVTTYEIPECDTFIDSLAKVDVVSIEMADNVWKLLEKHIQRYFRENKNVNVFNVVKICREHYRQTLEYNVEVNNLSSLHLYQATEDNKDGFYSRVYEDALG